MAKQILFDNIYVYDSILENDVILIIAGAGGYGMASVEVAANIFKAKVCIVLSHL